MSRKRLKFLTITQVLAIHHRMIKNFGGSEGIRDLGLVESAVARPELGIGERYLYKTIFDKAATLMQSLLKNHAFVDGNKRTALTSAGIFLKMNDWKLVNTHKDEVNFTLKVDNENLSIKEISNWLKEHSIKVSGSK